MFAALGLVTASWAFSAPASERTVLVNEINANPQNLWKAASYPRFDGQPVGAAKAMCGVDINLYLQNLRSSIESGEVQVDETEVQANDLPESFDAASNPAWKSCATVISDIRDQSACGCCSCRRVRASDCPQFARSPLIASASHCDQAGRLVLPRPRPTACALRPVGRSPCPCRRKTCASVAATTDAKADFRPPRWFRIMQHGIATGGQINGPHAVDAKDARPPYSPLPRSNAL